jgi:hypothetical protein
MHLLLLPKGLPGLLAVWPVTIPLVFDPGIWKKNIVAMLTMLLVHGFPPGITIIRSSLSGMEENKNYKDRSERKREETFGRFLSWRLDTSPKIRKKIQMRYGMEEKRKKTNPWLVFTPAPLAYFLTEENGILSNRG